MIVVFAIAGLVLGIAIALMTPTKARYKAMIVGARPGGRSHPEDLLRSDRNAGATTNFSFHRPDCDHRRRRHHRHLLRVDHGEKADYPDCDSGFDRGLCSDRSNALGGLTKSRCRRHSIHATDHQDAIV